MSLTYKKIMATWINSEWSIYICIFFVDMSDLHGKLYATEYKMETNMLSEKLVVVLKSKAKLIDEQIASITESEGWEIIQDIELLNRKKSGSAKLVQ